MEKIIGITMGDISNPNSLIEAIKIANILS